MATSTAVAEHIAMSHVTRHSIPMRRVLLEIIDHMQLKTIRDSVVKSTVHEGNMAALQNARSQRVFPKLKFVAIKFYFSKSHLGTDIQLVEIDSAQQKGAFSPRNCQGTSSSNSAGSCVIGEPERRRGKKCGCWHLCVCVCVCVSSDMAHQGHSEVQDRQGTDVESSDLTESIESTLHVDWPNPSNLGHKASSIIHIHQFDMRSSIKSSTSIDLNGILWR